MANEQQVAPDNQITISEKVLLDNITSHTKLIQDHRNTISNLTSAIQQIEGKLQLLRDLHNIMVTNLAKQKADAEAAAAELAAAPKIAPVPTVVENN